MRPIWKRSPILLRRATSLPFRRHHSSPTHTLHTQAVDSSTQNLIGSHVRTEATTSTASARGWDLDTEEQEMFVGFVPLGRDWALDIVGLPHNAVRRELRGLYCFVQGAEIACDTALVTAREWFACLAEFIECVFALEERVVFEWLKMGGANLPETMSKTRRAVRYGRARAMCIAVDDALRNRTGVRSAVDRLANVLLSHFAAVESIIPQLARNMYAKEMKGRVVQAMATPLAHAKPEMFMLLARGFDDECLQRRFIQAYGRKTDTDEFLRRINDFESARIEVLYKFMEEGSGSIERPPGSTLPTTGRAQ